MSLEPPIWYVGDRLPEISTIIKTNGVAVNVSAHTINAKMRAMNSATLKVDTTGAFVSDGTDGAVKYAWDADDLDTENLYLFWFEAVLGGKIQAIQEMLIEVRSHGPVAGDLCELEQVRQAMEIKPTDRKLDDQIRALIPVASQLVQEEIRRELTPTASATRDFPIRSGIIDLDPYDLRSVTTMTLNPSTSPTVLSASDYRLHPIGGAAIGGTFTEVELAAGIAWQDNGDFGGGVLRIAGAWGHTSVPRIATQAAILCVRAWLRRDQATYAGVGDDMRTVVTGMENTYALPRAAKSILRSLYRYPSVY